MSESTQPPVPPVPPTNNSGLPESPLPSREGGAGQSSGLGQGGMNFPMPPLPPPQLIDALRGVDPQVVNKFQEIVDNVMFARQEFMRRLLDPRRDIDTECGFPKGYIDPRMYYELYEREALAARVVQVMPKQSWQIQPQIYDSEDSEEVTPFEEAWDNLGRSLRGESSWYGEEEGSPVWEYLQRADELSGIGSYGVILLGLDDGKRLDEPVELISRRKEGDDEAEDSLPGMTSGARPDSPFASSPHSLFSPSSQGSQSQDPHRITGQGTDAQYEIGSLAPKKGNLGAPPTMFRPSSSSAVPAPPVTEAGRKGGESKFRAPGDEDVEDTPPSFSPRVGPAAGPTKGGRKPPGLRGKKSSKDSGIVPTGEGAGKEPRAKKPLRPGGVLPSTPAEAAQQGGSALKTPDGVDPAKEMEAAGWIDLTGGAGIPGVPGSGSKNGKGGVPGRPVQGSPYGTPTGGLGDGFYPTGEEGGAPWLYADRQGLEGKGGPKGKEGEESKKLKRKLLYIRCFPEVMAPIVRFETDETSPRFGQPLEYQITFNDPSAASSSSAIGLTTMTRKVHWTRVIHIADNLSSSEVFGVPRMRPVLNNLLGLRKLYAGSPEMFWKGAFPGVALSTHPTLGGDVPVDKSSIRDMMENWANGLQRYLMLIGMSAQTLAPTVADPTSQINVQLEAICIQLEIPLRIFKGSERGELASSQDDGQWNDTLRRRQKNYLTPKLIVPFIDRLIAMGVLPEPQPPKDPMDVDGDVSNPLLAKGELGGKGPLGGETEEDEEEDEEGGEFDLGQSEGEEEEAIEKGEEDLETLPKGKEEEEEDRTPLARLRHNALQRYLKLRKRRLTRNDLPPWLSKTSGSVKRKEGEEEKTSKNGKGAKSKGRFPFKKGKDSRDPNDPDGGEFDDEGNPIDPEDPKALAQLEAKGGTGQGAFPSGKMPAKPGGLKQKTVAGYVVAWPDTTAQSDQEKAQVAFTKTGALAQYISGQLGEFFTKLDYLVHIWGMEEQEAAQIIENAEAEAELKAAEEEAEQAEMMAAQMGMMADQGIDPSMMGMGGLPGMDGSGEVPPPGGPPSMGMGGGGKAPPPGMGGGNMGKLPPLKGEPAIPTGKKGKPF